MMPDDASVVIVANPNNPDGRTTDPAKLVALAEQLGDAGGFLVVDEAFADVAPDISLVPDLAGLPAVVLRSFGKFYGLAGLRLGFLIGDRSIVSLVEQLLGDWPVSGPAVAIGAAALADDDWRDTTRRRLATDADRFGDILASHRLHTIGGTDLFALVEDDDAPEIHDRLARQGIWTRVFADRPRWLRLGLPPPRGFDRLDRALRNVR
jgi:cobalamin biosynthetic protein CobC